MTGLSFRRFGRLLLKEALQMERDPSIFFMAIGLPVILILLFGFGLSMDLNHVPAALVMGERTPLTQALAAEFEGSPYFEIRTLQARAEAERLLDARRIDAVIELPQGLSRDAQLGEGVVGLTIHGVDSSAASIIRTYASATVALALEKISEREDAASVLGISSSSALGSITLVSRSWFNEANTSAWYLVPGLLVVVLTLTSSFLGSLVIAREWERGTMETLCVTPATPLEIVSAKFLSNYALTLIGCLTAFASAWLVFGVPVRGSVWLLAATLAVYLAWTIAFGLFLSAATKSQFVAIQMAVIGSYLPALMLSGYLFDLRSVPWFIAAVGRLMPPTYAIESVKILCLSGGSHRLVLSNLAILGAWTSVFFALALFKTRKRLD